MMRRGGTCLKPPTVRLSRPLKKRETHRKGAETPRGERKSLMKIEHLLSLPLSASAVKFSFSAPVRRTFPRARRRSTFRPKPLVRRGSFSPQSLPFLEGRRVFQRPGDNRRFHSPDESAHARERRDSSSIG